MHSLTTAPSFSSLSFHFFPHRHRHRHRHRHHHTLFQLTPPFIFSFQYTTAKRLQVQLHVQEEKSLRKKKGRKGLCCKEDLGGAEEEVFSPLEAEILEFMRSSTKSSAFPTREELVAAGRVDLIDAIVTKECYLVYGWDLDRGSRESYDFDGASVAEIHGQASMASGFSSSSDGDNSCKQAKSMDIEVEESGIEGILNRLERQRSNSFGLGLTEKDESDPSRNSEDKDTVSTLHGGLIKLDQHRSQLGSENLRNSLEPDTWRSWIIQRNGSSNVAFEGNVFYFQVVSDQKNSSDDLAEYSDAWEFQETEIMNAQDRLRSIRAKLSVLEGKMSLAIMDAHKIVEEKQKRINNAHRALQTLKTICVVWHNPSSQIYLVGSFDGWSTQRKMEKSNTGIFSLNLLLYPGKYEIKFIVDGEWKVDPLLPIVVTNKGYENNLLVVHD
ncbi:protein FLOURY ENDOSPERM 6, chloroplastic [Arachis duranensis]|uniref:Protein FLOURY ENDOSPERM 6, chloroplastic n=1 Tax=Arachis duranensis TaxID=130453 RepID=A0A9C6TXL5_ARADU|nr:protein FLOURY ENDOSPERM 6, chloroplastic [Arachis duranensis]